MNCLPGGLVLVDPEGASGLRGFHNHITVYLEQGLLSYLWATLCKHRSIVAKIDKKADNIKRKNVFLNYFFAFYMFQVVRTRFFIQGKWK